MSFVKRTRNYRIREQNSKRNLETESQPEWIGETKDIYLWTGVPHHTFESTKKKVVNKWWLGKPRTLFLCCCMWLRVYVQRGPTFFIVFGSNLDRYVSCYRVSSVHIGQFQNIIWNEATAASLEILFQLTGHLNIRHQLVRRTSSVITDAVLVRSSISPFRSGLYVEYALSNTWSRKTKLESPSFSAVLLYSDKSKKLSSCV
jgi:hypothetical protein